MSSSVTYGLNGRVYRIAIRFYDGLLTILWHISTQRCLCCLSTGWTHYYRHLPETVHSSPWWCSYCAAVNIFRAWLAVICCPWSLMFSILSFRGLPCPCAQFTFFFLMRHNQAFSRLSSWSVACWIDLACLFLDCQFPFISAALKFPYWWNYLWRAWVWLSHCSLSCDATYQQQTSYRGLRSFTYLISHLFCHRERGMAAWSSWHRWSYSSHNFFDEQSPRSKGFLPFVRPARLPIRNSVVCPMSTRFFSSWRVHSWYVRITSFAIVFLWPIIIERPPICLFLTKNNTYLG